MLCNMRILVRFIGDTGSRNVEAESFCELLMCVGLNNLLFCLRICTNKYVFCQSKKFCFLRKTFFLLNKCLSFEFNSCKFLCINVNEKKNNCFNNKIENSKNDRKSIFPCPVVVDSIKNPIIL